MPAPLGERLVLNREYPDPIDDVWSALTESDRLGRWIGTYTGRGRPGGTVEFVMTGEADAGGEVADPVTVTVHECEAPRRLVVDIPESESATRSWRLELVLTPSGTGTALVFTQDLLDGMGRADIEAGWNWYLDRLEASLHAAPMPDWADYAPAVT
jgi:uncharacterized protein YndB with AHSA1/START domain